VGGPLQSYIIFPFHCADGSWKDWLKNLKNKMKKSKKQAVVDNCGFCYLRLFTTLLEVLR